MGAVALTCPPILPPEAGFRTRRPPVSAVPSPAAGEPLDALRRRLEAAGGDAQAAVLADFVEDDLRELEGTLGVVSRYLASVEEALGEPEPGRRHLLRLALGRGPMEQLEYLETTFASLRRRLAQVAVRLPP